MIRYKREIKLDFPTGYNISIQPNGSKMIAYIRETIQNDNQGACPLGFNFLHKAILDEDYKVESVFRVNDKSSIPKYTSYTHGVEDCRIINDSLLYGVCLFTNNSWGSRIMYVCGGKQCNQGNDSNAYAQFTLSYSREKLVVLERNG